MSADFISTPHIGSEELAGYLDNRLDAAWSARVEAHLASCADCRAELVHARALLDSAPAETIEPSVGRARRVRPWLAAAGILAIASLPLLDRALRPRDESPRFRAASSAASRIEIVSPDSRSLNASAITFAWRAVEGASTYHLTLTDSAGTPLFSLVTADTSVQPPAGAELHGGSSYLWYVDGLTREGRTLTSGVHSFSTLP
jgi:predicted anti-sigma-YlaC factor YlaD